MLIFLTVVIALVQFIAALVALMRYKNLQGTTEAYFVYFLVYVFVNEMMGIFIPQFGISNALLYNVFTLTSIMFYLYWYSKIMPRLGKYLDYMAIFYLIVYAWDAIQNGVTSMLLEKPLVIGTLIIILCTTMFFYELLRSEGVEFFLRDRRFWFVTGMFIFYVSFLPLLVLTHFKEAFQPSFRVSITILNIILYSCFIIGILVGRDQNVKEL